MVYSIYIVYTYTHNMKNKYIIYMSDYVFINRVHTVNSIRILTLAIANYI